MKPISIPEEIKKRGGPRKVAANLGISTQAVYLYMRDEREPSEKILEYLGLERIITYRRMRKARCQPTESPKTVKS